MKDDLFTDEEQVPYDMVTLLPLRDARFESSECPGYIDAIKSYDKEGAYHPLGKEGFPVFDVYLDEDGNIIT
jgi:hypothetical protein